MTESKLLDLNDCDVSYKKIYKEMLEISLLKNPKWFRYLYKKSLLIQKYLGYDRPFSRAWEYPWAIHVANLTKRCRFVDVGGGGSPFADYLAKQGHDSYVIDPSLDQGISLFIDRNKRVFQNIRSFIFGFAFYLLKVNRKCGIKTAVRNTDVKYFPQGADSIDFQDNYFDRVFCLSVMEHIPQEDWKKCIQEFERVLKPGGRLIITLDMDLEEANNRLYLKLVDYCTLPLIGDPYYDVPISQEDREKRNGGHFYETIGLVWQA